MVVEDNVKVLSGPEEDGVVEIESGPYVIRFIWKRGKAKKIGFRYSGHRLKDPYIPDCFFKPAAARANIVFTGRIERAKRKVEAIQGTLPLEIPNGTA